MQTILTILLQNLLLIFGVFAVLWLASLKLRDASIVDPCWGAGFVLLAWATYTRLAVPGQRATLLVSLVSLWGMRLSLYLFWRNWEKDEDRRYRAMREKHGERFWWISLLTIFLLQAVLLWFISWPVQLGMLSEVPLGAFDAVGTLICLVGIAFESIGDWQLARFKADPAHKGRVMQSGLWRYTRHPNYFGDALVWWGLFIIALGAGGWWTVFSPLLMNYLLVNVSGVAMLESTLKTRKPEYAEYIRRTSAFIPRPPKD